MRRLKQGLALGAVLALGLTACGSDDDGDGGGGDVSGSLLIWADENRAGPVGELAQAWGDENGVAVEVVQINFDDLKDQYAQQAPAGQGPDIFIGANDWSGEFAASGLIAPIDLGDNRGNFNPAAVDAFTVDGQTYGVPIATENIVMFRNTDLAPESPASINEMAETGLALQAEGKTQFPIGLQVGDKGDAYHAYPFLSAAGGYFFGGPDGDGNYDVNDVGIASEGGLVFAEAWAQFGADGVIKSTFTGGDLADRVGGRPAAVLDHRSVEQGQGRGVRRAVRGRAGARLGWRERDVGPDRGRPGLLPEPELHEPDDGAGLPGCHDEHRVHGQHLRSRSATPGMVGFRRGSQR